MRRAGGGGNVVGPGTSTAGDLAAFSDIAGAALVDSGLNLSTATVGLNTTDTLTNITNHSLTLLGKKNSTLQSATVTGSATGGDVSLISASSVDGDSGYVNLTAGTASGDGSGGIIDIIAGSAEGGGNAGDVNITAGNASASVGGNIYLFSGTGTTSGAVIVDGALISSGYHIDPSSDNVSGTGSVSVDFTTASSKVVSLTADTTLSFTGLTTGGAYVLTIVQGSTPRTLAFTGVLWPGGVAPTVSTGSGAIDVINLFYDGANNLLGTFALNFS